jgi:hypothetical protein
MPERHIKIFKEKVFFLDGAFWYYCDKNMSQSSMTLAECHTPRFFKLNHSKCLKVIPERPIPQLREWRSEALRDNTDLNMGRSAMQFSTPDAP